VVEVTRVVILQLRVTEDPLVETQTLAVVVVEAVELMLLALAEMVVQVVLLP
jgi:hypothetical protein